MAVQLDHLGRGTGAALWALISSSVLRTAPGLALAAVIAAAAFALRLVPGVDALSPLVIAMLLGLVLHPTLGARTWPRPGLAAAMRLVLRFAIILLGFQLTLTQIRDVGLAGLTITVAAAASTFVVTIWLGKLIGVDRKLAELLAAGTSICGASAIVATNTVTRAREEDVAYALASITIFGSVAIFVYPLIAEMIGLNAWDYGVWTGASIHEVAQVIAAAFQGGELAGTYGTTVKLARVLLLAPMVIILGVIAARRLRGTATDGAASTPVPVFIVGFLVVVVANTFIPVPTALRDGLAMATSFLLTMALGATGLMVNASKILTRGVRPMLLGIAATVFIAAFSLILIGIAG